MHNAQAICLKWNNSLMVLFFFFLFILFILCLFHFWNKNYTYGSFWIWTWKGHAACAIEWMISNSGVYETGIKWKMEIIAYLLYRYAKQASERARPSSHEEKACGLCFFALYFSLQILFIEFTLSSTRNTLNIVKLAVGAWKQQERMRKENDT